MNLFIYIAFKINLAYRWLPFLQEARIKSTPHEPVGFTQMVHVMISTQALVLRIIRILHSLHTTEFWTRKGFTFVWTFVEKISTRSEIHLIYDSPVLTTPFLLRLRSYRRFSRMYNTRVRFACPIYFSRDQSSSKLIIFLDSKLERSNSRVAKIDSRLDSRNFRGSRIESRVEFRNSRVTVTLPLSGTVIQNKQEQQGPQIK